MEQKTYPRIPRDGKKRAVNNEQVLTSDDEDRSTDENGGIGVDDLDKLGFASLMSP